MNRTLYLSLVVLGISALVVGAAYYYRTNSKVFGQAQVYVLPPLPYAYNALEPYIDEQTMRIHYTKHHQAYVNKLNAALKDYPQVSKKPLEYLLAHTKEIPKAIRTAVINNGGGHWNHSFFWEVMTPTSTKQPVGSVGEAIKKQFGSFDEFKKEFNKAALTVFGSGWAWLVYDKGKLRVIATANQDSPLTLGLTPLLALDVWEHAYYLKYQNRRGDYNEAWWQVVNWDQVEKNYQKATGDIHGN